MTEGMQSLSDRNESWSRSLPGFLLFFSESYFTYELIFFWHIIMYLKDCADGIVETPAVETHLEHGTEVITSFKIFKEVRRHFGEKYSF